MDNSPTIQEILQRYKEGQRQFKDLDIEGDFSHQNLEGIEFEGCFIAADFRYCNLENSKFWNGNIKTSDFSYSILTNAVFTGLAVEGTDFKEAETEGLVFEGNYCFGQVVGQVDFEELFKGGAGV